MEAIVHDCGILSYPNEHWNNLTNSDWTALAENWPACLGSLGELRFATSCFASSIHLQFMEMHRVAARAKLERLMGRHDDDYFAIVPRNILEIVLQFLRVESRTWWKHEVPKLALLGLQHSWDDQPSHQFVNDNESRVYEWYWCGWLHREGGQPAHVSIGKHGCFFNWFLRGKHGRIGSDVTHMQRVNGVYSYGIPGNLAVTTDPVVVAEIDSLVARYSH